MLKWLCGGPGGAFLYASAEASRTLTPSFTGWQAHERPFAFEAEMHYAEDAWRWLNGTPPIPALFAAIEGPRIVRRAGDRRDSREEHSPDDAADRARRRARLPRVGAARCGASRRNGRVRRAARVRRVAQALLAQRRDRGLPARRRHSRRAALLHARCGARARRRR